MFESRRNKDGKIERSGYRGIGSYSFGHISFAAFVISAVTGILLAIPYDVSKPFDSVSMMLISNGGAVIFRILHYWSAQLFLVFFILHIWDHFTLSTETKVKSGVWLRLTVSIFFSLFVMLTGFILKGDIESRQAARIFNSLFESIPVAGKTLSYIFLGSEGDYQITYVHHIATATIFLWIVIIEHAKSFWPRMRLSLYLLLPLFVLGLFFPPALYDDTHAVVKGPWYFLGLQEMLHWISQPALVLIILAVFLLMIYLLPKLAFEKSLLVKKIIYISFGVYAILTIIGYFFRGENWQFTWPWNNPYFYKTEFNPGDNARMIFGIDYSNQNVPVVLGKREACLSCHENIAGFSSSHDPAAIGCSSCHSGNSFTLDKELAHKGMILIPGNLDNAGNTCGTPACHPQITDRVKNSIMNTMSGVVSVDRFVFGESETPSVLSNVADIGFTPADSHLRNLCASCHLGGRKSEYGPINDQSRGGGCVACHLSYSRNSVEELEEYTSFRNKGRTGFNFRFHPALKLADSNNNCFGCHSRSGRISTNYEGWHETLLSEEEISGKEGYRVLGDGRVFKKVTDDIHHRQGMLCVDCHVSYEVMGDGNLYMHKEQQVKIQCEDCHLTAEPSVKTLDEFDSESLKAARLRKMDVPGRKYLTQKQSGYPLVNTYLDENKNAMMIKKATGETVGMKIPVASCTAGKSHKDLACTTCHSSWSPQCVGCHTGFDANGTGFDLLAEKESRGEWIEKQGDYIAEPPVLGIRMTQSNGIAKRSVDNFIPGMVLSIDKGEKGGKIFKRLYAPAFSHTIVKESRNCESCHNNPLAIGYGRGKLSYDIRNRKGVWNFVPDYMPEQDGLPSDAWIGFLKEPTGNASTRTDTRPFSLEEQKRILTVGTCLTCHKSDSGIMKESLLDFEKVYSRRKNSCVIPAWP